MSLLPSKPAVQETTTTRDPFESTLKFIGGSGTTVKINEDYFFLTDKKKRAQSAN